MAKRGRPRKSGHREASGRLQRPTLAQLKNVEAAKRLRETDAVASQPHRRWAPDPRDPRLATALGRFCVRYKARTELYDAGVEWTETYRRLLAALGAPDPNHSSALGSGGDGPSKATIDGWERKIEGVERAVLKYGQSAYHGIRQLCMEDADVPGHEAADAILGLRVLAVTLGRLPSGAHPFVDSGRAAA
jgi:hypothetical protein